MGAFVYFTPLGVCISPLRQVPSEAKHFSFGDGPMNARLCFVIALIGCLGCSRLGERPAATGTDAAESLSTLKTDYPK
jgi:hypothetical protein